MLSHSKETICMKYEILISGKKRRVGHILSWRFDDEIFSTISFFLPLIQEGQLLVSGVRMCTLLVAHLQD